MKFFLPILFTLLSIVIFLFVVNPFYHQVSGLRSGIARYNEALASSTNLQKTEDSLLTTYNEISQTDKDRLKNFLPSSVNNIQFILELERVANLHNMPIKNIKFNTVNSDSMPTDPNAITSDNPADNLPYGTFPIEFQTEGKYSDFLGFINDLEHNLRLVDIQSVDFSVPDTTTLQAGQSSDTYTYSLKAEIYWLK